MAFAKFNQCEPCCCTGLTITKFLNGVRQVGSTIQLFDASGILAGSCITNDSGNCSIKVPKNQIYTLIGGECTPNQNISVGCNTNININNTARICVNTNANCSPGPSGISGLYPLNNATVTISGPGGFSATGSGRPFCVDIFASGTYTITSSAEGYQERSAVINNPCSNILTTITLPRSTINMRFGGRLFDCSNRSCPTGNDGINITVGGQSGTTDDNGDIEGVFELVPGTITTITATKGGFKPISAPFTVPSCDVAGVGTVSLQVEDGLFCFPPDDCFDPIPDQVSVTLNINHGSYSDCNQTVTCYRRPYTLCNPVYDGILCCAGHSCSGPFPSPWNVMVSLISGGCSKNVSEPEGNLGYKGDVLVYFQSLCPSQGVCTDVIFPGIGTNNVGNTTPVSAVGTVACPTSFTLTGNNGSTATVSL